VHYYQHHIGDFIRATARLTDAQTMAYLRLMWRYYDKQKPLVNDYKILAFQIGSDEETVRLILTCYFELDDQGLWRNTRCDKEIAEYKQMQEKKSKAGKASAERKKNTGGSTVEHKDSIRSTDVEQVLDDSSATVQLTSNHKPITNNQEPVTSTNRRSNTRKRVDRPDDVTESVWEAWVELRNSKRAPISDVAVDKIRKEAAKASMSLDAALEMCCARGWQGFNAEWVDKRDKKEAAMDFLLGRTDVAGNRIVEPAPWDVVDEPKRIL
jgi:uncharacterized protein YdaU (DUF1376 family)